MSTQLDAGIRSVGELIREARKRLDLTQEDLARLVGARQGTIARWESGAHQIKLVDASDIAEALRIPAQVVFDAVKREKALTPKGEDQTCALTGSNRGPADYGPAACRGGALVPDHVPAWLVAEVSRLAR